ncbi:hypothetical protein HDU87_008198 [Geranomyces variabilis]|uniref:Uncharacterized protein n=1 Tax=Geranomyces variabilis TaxID=109894 RepID=A0AAD5TCZ4_9FUNG|nr:hypothetical protein HDU87_008198 [Geranomyces variabilis]
MATLFGFASSKTEPKDADDAAATAEEGATDASPTSPQAAEEDDTPLFEAPETEVGAQTSCMHFVARSKLGWIAWKEMEATLYSIFERSFGATRCEMKFSDSLEDFGFEVEVPNTEVEKFKKFFKGKALAQEIDMLHGIDPLTTSRRDAKLVNMKKTLGSTLQETDVRSSIEVLTKRFKALEQVGVNRDREVSAIQDQFAFMQTTMLKRFDDTGARFQAKMEDAVWKKMGAVEKEIRDSVQQDLAVLNMNPMEKQVSTPTAAAAPPPPQPQGIPPALSTAPSAAQLLPAEDPILRQRAETAEETLASVTLERDAARQELQASQRRLEEMRGELAKVSEDFGKLRDVEEARAALAAQFEALNRDAGEMRTERELLRKELAEAQAEQEALNARKPTEPAPTVETKANEASAVVAQTTEPATVPRTDEATAEASSLSEFIRENPVKEKKEPDEVESDPWRESPR